MSVKNPYPAFLLAIVMAAACTAPAFSQSPNPERFRNGSIGVEFMRPVLDDEEVDVLMGSILYARVPIGLFYLVAEVPYAVTSEDDESSQALGNIMLGLETGSRRVTLFAGVRAPTAPEDEVATFVGFLGDFMRPEAWIGNLWSVNAGVRLHNRAASGLGYEVAFSASAFLPEEATKDVLLNYGAQLSYRPRAFGIAGGIAGRAIMTEEDADIGERTIHEAQLRLDYTVRRWRPVIDFRLPLDADLSEAINGVVRIGVEYSFN